MIDSSWEWTFISLIALVVGYYTYRNMLSDFYDQWKASKPEVKIAEKPGYDTFNDPLSEDRIFESTVPREKQGFKVTPNHPHRNH